jgi:hypothetical protein
MTRGLCRMRSGWATEDSVLVEYDDGKQLEVPASQYVANGYEPPIDDLPECTQDSNDRRG